MSTRSIVAMKLDTSAASVNSKPVGETYRCIYVHFDGYPEGIGAELLEHYTTTEKVESLLDEGDCSSISDGVAESYRSRGETDCNADIVNGDIHKLAEYARDCWGAFLYVWDGTETGWTAYALHCDD